MDKQENNSMEKLYDNFTKYFSVIIFLIVILVLSLFYFFLINPKLQASSKEIQKDINFQQNIWQIERQKLLQMQDSLDYFKKIDSNDIEFLESIIPHPYPKEKLFGEIEDIILKNGYTLTSLNLEEIEKTEEGDEFQTEESQELSLVDKNLQIINISLEATGLDYNAMKRFLIVLENQLPLMDIISLDFSPEGETLILDINTYYFKS
jgi:hypothetical protein